MPLQGKVRRAILRAQADPVFFARHILGVEPWGEQRRILELAVSHPEGAMRLAIRSCHGAGKSFALAVLILWFTASHVNAVTIVTANTWDQALTTVWAEVRNLYHQSVEDLGGEMLSTKWVLGPKWFATVMSPDKPDSASGKHAEWLLEVVDEASGLSADMAEALEGNLTSGHATLVYSGNPLRPSGPFYEAFRGPISDVWKHMHISALGKRGRFLLPEDVPGLTSREWIELRRREWGEGSPAWQARVLGEFPDAAEDSLIPLSLVEEAEKRPSPRAGRNRLGADTARFGGDETVFAVRNDVGVRAVESFRALRETEIAGRAKRYMGEYDVAASDVFVDNTGGYGAGAVDILLETHGLEVNGVNFGGAARDPEQFANERAEMYWLLMLAMRDEGFSLLNAGAAVGGQLAAIRKEFDSKGRIKLEPKEKIKKRVGRSPDHADALALTFVPPPAPVARPNATLL